ncbi:acetylglutamate kinase [Ignicoccus islandicus DSM 13165]|uniref:Putative [LysW]-aminoadipate/[LysW]-glutamate kinase n=1 Tax=Ignicoccus islandicus DSM 13165 TaxID=940295 RepID=A0A0U3F775_9CREN|nr:[LysW]-aminoadipate/[LysW]-glutamate kinase [Ignicoccus islandicus]ALU11912.1 acetylglutamate kinase [Ignicoccus islandicus DSM 13165]
MIVVKAGGRTLLNNMDNIVRDIARFEGVVFVHGGGDLVDEWERKMGIEPKFKISASGIKFRYTDETELEVFVAVLGGLLNKRIVSSLERLGKKAIGLTGADGKLVVADRKKRVIVKEKVGEREIKRAIPGGYTGKIKEVNGDLLTKLVEMGYTPVIAPIAISEEGELLNVNGDQMASEIAKAVRADYLVLLTDVPGVLMNGEVIKEIKSSEAEEIAKEIGPGMNIKVIMAGRVASSGTKVVICDGTRENPLRCLETGEGTWVVP